MTLLGAVQKVAGEAAFAVDSSGVIDATDVTTVQLRSIAQRVIQEMALAAPWTRLYAQGSITLVAGQATYALPDAFDYQMYESFWNQSTRWRVVGPMSEQEYAEIQGYGLNSTYYKRYQLRGITDNRITITPTPTSADAGDVIIFEYIAARYVRPRTWAASRSITSGEYCFYNGNYYTAASTTTDGSTAPTHTSGTTGNWTYYSGAYREFLADTDEPILPQRVLEQGMLERFGEHHSLEVVPRFQDQLREEIAKDNPGRLLYAGGDRSRVMAARSGRAVFGTWI